MFEAVTDPALVVVGRFTPTDVYPPYGDEWRAFGFRTDADLRSWIDDAGLWYPDATIYRGLDEFREGPHGHLTVEQPALR